MIGDVLNALIAAGCNPRRNGKGYSARCPAHDDTKPSLSIAEGTKAVVVTCHAGCDLERILAAARIPREALRLEPADEAAEDRWTPSGEAIATYDYTDEDGNLLFQVVRCVGKKFLQRRPDPTAKSGWVWRVGDVRKPLYRLPRVLRAISEGEPIFVCEGEKDVHAIERAGYTATCNPGGAGKWTAEHTRTLADADVIIVADRDDVGRRHARTVAAELAGVAQAVTRVEPLVGKDASDHLEAGHSIEEFIVVDDNERRADLAPDLDEFLAGFDEPYDWIIPGLLERGDRLILTGWEGRGKSVALFQIAVCAAAGLHPFRFDPVAPRRVLLIDAENSERQARRQLRPMRDQAVRQGRAVGPDMLRILIRPPGTLDITTPDDSAWLVERVVAHKPDILILGPLYQLHRQNPNDEMAARATVATLDAARAVSGCAIILEAHTGHADWGKERGIRPTGSSLWLRWPEFGYGIVPKKAEAGEHRFGERMWFRHWRGPRDERQWPDELQRGTGWPWEGIWSKGMEDLPW